MATFLKGEKVELRRSVRCPSGKIMPAGEIGLVTRRQDASGAAMVLFESYHIYLRADSSLLQHISPAAPE
jgi:queuine/archaeosine tRNA-ribosyltransferase